MRRNTVETVVSLDFILYAFMLVDHLYPIILQHHRGHHDVVKHFVRELAQKALDNLIHAAYWLEQHGACFTLILA